MPRTPVVVRLARSGDLPVLATILARAFADDPALAHVFADPASRPKRLRRFFALMLRVEPHAALTDIACTPGGDAAAVAVWRAPGRWRTPVATMLREALPMLAVFGAALPRALRLQAQLEANHPPGPHWYLEFLGCAPDRQGQGFGGAAIRTRLARCDASGECAALETANPANVPLYTALGFAVTHDFEVTPDLRFWCMWREPR